MNPHLQRTMAIVRQANLMAYVLESVLRDYNLSHRQYEVLLFVQQRGEPTMQVVIDYFIAGEELQAYGSPRLPIPDMTRFVERIEPTGYIFRVIDPADNRIRRLIITKKGREALAEIEADLAERCEHMLKRWDNLNL